MDHTKRRTDDTLRDQPGNLPPPSHQPGPLDDAAQLPEYLRATLKNTRTRSQRLHEHQPAQRRLTIQETQQHTKTRADTRNPIPLPLKRRPRTRRQLLDTVVKRREKTIFAVG